MVHFSPRKILSAFMVNWAARVLAFLLALFLFVFHRLSILESRIFSAPLQIEANPEFVPANIFPRMVQVTLRGEKDRISPVQDDDIVVYLDLKRYDTEGNYRAPVQFRKKGTALGVEPLEIRVDPVEIHLELDRKASRYVAVMPDFTGALAPGYEMVSYTLNPAQVAVEGPEKLMGDLLELHTEPIDLGGRSDDFFEQSAIRIEDPRMVIRGPGSAEFHGIVKQHIIIRSFENLPITIRGLSGDFSAVTEVLSGSIRIQGNQDALEKYRPPANILSLDCSEISRPGSYTLSVRADIPAEFTLIRSDPTAVTVQVDAK